jgi:hypothetical protein
MARRPRRPSHIEIDDLTGQVSEVYENALEQGAEVLRAALDEVTERPLTALFAAFTAGILAEHLLRRRRAWAFRR